MLTHFENSKKCPDEGGVFHQGCIGTQVCFFFFCISVSPHLGVPLHVGVVVV